jgi:hypothetical protein
MLETLHKDISKSTEPCSGVHAYRQTVSPQIQATDAGLGAPFVGEPTRRPFPLHP